MNENILAAIAEKTKERIREERRKIPLFEMRNNAEAVAAFGTGRQNRPTFYQALAKPGMSFICEVKKASPSKGVIAEDFPYLQIAGEYEAAGAAAGRPCYTIIKGGVPYGSAAGPVHSF